MEAKGGHWPLTTLHTELGVISGLLIFSTHRTQGQQKALLTGLGDNRSMALFTGLRGNRSKALLTGLGDNRSMALFTGLRGNRSKALLTGLGDNRS